MSMLLKRQQNAAGQGVKYQTSPGNKSSPHTLTPTTLHKVDEEANQSVEPFTLQSEYDTETHNPR